MSTSLLTEWPDNGLLKFNGLRMARKITSRQKSCLGLLNAWTSQDNDLIKDILIFSGQKWLLGLIEGVFMGGPAAFLPTVTR